MKKRYRADDTNLLNTKDQIKKVFLSLYQTKPLNKIKVTDLIESSNISRSTFYFYYEDIRSLYCECEREMLEVLEQGQSKVVLATVGQSYEQFVFYVCQDIKQYGTEKYCNLRIFLTGSEANLFCRKWFDSIRRHYDKSLEFMPTMTSEARENATLFFAGGHLELLKRYVLCGHMDPKMAEDIARTAADAIFKGLLAPKPTGPNKF